MVVLLFLSRNIYFVLLYAPIIVLFDKMYISYIFTGIDVFHSFPTPDILPELTPVWALVFIGRRLDLSHTFCSLVGVLHILSHKSMR